MPEVVQGINAFALGMREANPKAQVKVVWLNTWFDPAREREAATDADQSRCADVLTNHSGSPAVPQAAQAITSRTRACATIAYQSDMHTFALRRAARRSHPALGRLLHAGRALGDQRQLEAAAGVGRHEGRAGAVERDQRRRAGQGRRHEIAARRKAIVEGRFKPFSRTAGGQRRACVRLAAGSLGRRTRSRP